jgi:hypothetical protein
MEFYYEEHHKKLSVECPPKSYRQEDTDAYRWVYDDIDNDQNFISQYEKKPKRFNAKSDWKRCEAMSLSMYKDIDNATDRFYYFKELMNEKVFGILGTKIAHALLTKTDGVNERGKYGEEIIKGHFNHHPSKGHDYPKKFKIIASFIKQ